jgi:hypothetical protein
MLTREREEMAREGLRWAFSGITTAIRDGRCHPSLYEDASSEAGRRIFRGLGGLWRESDQAWAKWCFNQGYCSAMGAARASRRAGPPTIPLESVMGTRLEPRAPGDDCEDFAQLRDAMSELPGADREIILRCFSGEHQKDIARSFGWHQTRISQKKIEILGFLKRRMSRSSA